jgi:glyoxylase-like metal-dependent hydrolase (beta-lactamase superfamily II)
MQIHSIVAENWKMDGGAAFGVVPQTMWRKLIKPDENNLIPITSRCLLVVDGERKILFDTGMGNKQSEKYYGFRFLFGDHSLEKSLSEVGMTPGDITDVVFTHLHDDHCGGAVKLNANRQPELLFNNAVHHVSSDQWHWANHPNSREIGSFFKINFQPIETAGKLNLIDKPGYFTENIELFQVDGHTKGQMIPKIRFDEKTFVFTADFIPSAAHIPLPYIASVDIQPLIALKEKEAFLQEAIEQNYYLIFEHDLDTECCNLVMTEKGARIRSVFTLKEILN